MAKQKKKERIVRYREGDDISAYKEILHAYAEGLTIISSDPGSRAWWVIERTPSCGKDGRDYAVYEDISYKLRPWCTFGGEHYIERDLCFVCEEVLFNNYYDLKITALDTQFEYLSEHNLCLCHRCYKKQVLIDIG